MMNTTSMNFTDKSTLYSYMKVRLKGLIDGVPHLLADFANTSALLYEFLPDINWAGFYFMKDGQLVLGPFQGKPACVEIKTGSGVCGTAVKEQRPIVVKDVHKFPGHIACDSASRSEIVIPIHVGHKIIGVLDIDSPSLCRFDDEDLNGLLSIVEILEQHISPLVNLR